MSYQLDFCIAFFLDKKSYPKKGCVNKLFCIPSGEILWVILFFPCQCGIILSVPFGNAVSNYKIAEVTSFPSFPVFLSFRTYCEVLFSSYFFLMASTINQNLSWMLLWSRPHLFEVNHRHKKWSYIRFCLAKGRGTDSGNWGSSLTFKISNMPGFSLFSNVLVPGVGSHIFKHWSKESQNLPFRKA